MTKSKLGKHCSKLLQRRNYFLYFAGLLILTQLYIGYSFYRLTQEELADLRQEMYRKEHPDHFMSSAPVVSDTTAKVCCLPYLKYY